VSNPALDASLAELAAVLKRLSDESSVLNETITDFEKTLVEMGPGFAVWTRTPFRVVPYATPGGIFGSTLGFGKHGDHWRLLVRRARYKKNGENHEFSESVSTMPLVDATRDERAAAVSHFEELVAGLKDGAIARLKVVEAAQKQAR
jgi:hypothetical protein